MHHRCFGNIEAFAEKNMEGVMVVPVLGAYYSSLSIRICCI